MKRQFNNSLPSFCILMLLGLLIGTAVGAEPPSADDDASSYERPAAVKIRGHMKDLLSENAYRPRESFWQQLRDFFFRWEKSRPRMGSKLGRFLLWLFVFWSCVTLIAILVHFIWTLVVMTAAGKPQPPSARSAPDTAADKTEAELTALAAEMAQAGNYTMAVTYLMLAALKKLDARGLLRFHASKTNGDYLQDYPGDKPHYADFKSYVDIFEKSIYGRLIPERAAYDRMCVLMKTFDDREQQTA